MAARGQGQVCAARLECAQAPVVHILISYFLLPVSDEHMLPLFKGAVNDCVTFTEENACKSLTFLLSFRKIDLEKKKKEKGNEEEDIEGSKCGEGNQKRKQQHGNLFY